MASHGLCHNKLHSDPDKYVRAAVAEAGGYLTTLMHDAEPMVRMQAAQSDNRAVLEFLTTDRDATVARCARRTLFDLDNKLPDNL